jgi:hypothetical protein
VGSWNPPVVVGATLGRLAIEPDTARLSAPAGDWEDRWARGDVVRRSPLYHQSMTRAGRRMGRAMPPKRSPPRKRT